MKKIIIVAAVLLTGLFAAEKAQAQGFGVTAGMNFNSASYKDIQLDSKAGFSLGVTYLLDLPLGLSVQPSLVYMHKSADYSLVDGISAVQKVGSVNLPVSVQWGPDLIVARPFLDVTPYVGYSLSNKIDTDVAGLISGDANLENAFEYGVGVGAGINVWKLQAIVRYNWNFGTLGKLEDFKDLGLGDFKKENETFGGVSVSVAYFF